MAQRCLSPHQTVRVVYEKRCGFHRSGVHNRNDPYSSSLSARHLRENIPESPSLVYCRLLQKLMAHGLKVWQSRPSNQPRLLLVKSKAHACIYIYIYIHDGMGHQCWCDLLRAMNKRLPQSARKCRGRVVLPTVTRPSHCCGQLKLPRISTKALHYLPK